MQTIHDGGPGPTVWLLLCWNLKNGQVEVPSMQRVSGHTFGYPGAYVWDALAD
jgi:hypothetical protein